MEKSVNRSDWNTNDWTKAETAVGDTSSPVLIQSTIWKNERSKASIIIKVSDSVSQTWTVLKAQQRCDLKGCKASESILPVIFHLPLHADIHQGEMRKALTTQPWRNLRIPPNPGSFDVYCLVRYRWYCTKGVALINVKHIHCLLSNTQQYQVDAYGEVRSLLIGSFDVYRLDLR